MGLKNKKKLFILKNTKMFEMNSKCDIKAYLAISKFGIMKDVNPGVDNWNAN